MAHNEELKQYVTMLTDVLKLASEEITALKARVAASEAEAKAAQRQLHERLRENVSLRTRLTHLQAAAGEAGLCAGTQCERVRDTLSAAATSQTAPNGTELLATLRCVTVEEK